MAGRDVDSDVLAGAAGIDPARLLLLLEPAVATGLLVEVEGGWDYRFSHALVQEALYAELTRLQRAQLHGRIGEAAESFGGGDLDRVPVLAHHFAQAARVGHAEKAVAYAVRAAEQAAAGLAYDEAVRYWELALASCGPAGTLPPLPPADRAGPGPAADRRRAGRPRAPRRGRRPGHPPGRARHGHRGHQRLRRRHAVELVVLRRGQPAHGQRPARPARPAARRRPGLAAPRCWAPSPSSSTTARAPRAWPTPPRRSRWPARPATRSCWPAP